MHGKYVLTWRDTDQHCMPRTGPLRGGVHGVESRRVVRLSVPTRAELADFDDVWDDRGTFPTRLMRYR